MATRLAVHLGATSVFALHSEVRTPKFGAWHEANPAASEIKTFGIMIIPISPGAD